MGVDWSPFVAFVKRHERFVITTHTRPDGDALGSQLALAAALEACGKVVYRVIPSRLPPRYEFMDPERRVIAYEPPPSQDLQNCDAIVVVDTGTFNQLDRLAEFFRSSRAAKFVIDHHRTQDDLGGQRVVDTEAEACGRLIHQAIGALDIRLTPEMAQDLFIAVSTDTGWFRHSNTSAWTMELAAELIAAGARPTAVYEQIYESTTLPRLRLLSKALDRLQTRANGQIAITEIIQPDYEATGAIPLDTEDLINYPRSLIGVELALLFMETREGSVKVSFRSRNVVDVSQLAERFGGGGHRRAAGATIPGTLDEVRARVLAAAEDALK